MLRRVFVLVGVGSAILATLGASPASSAPTPPSPLNPPLTGETLVTSEIGQLSPTQPVGIGTTHLTGTCNATGNSTFTYTASGAALGPYDGTYTESGTFTIGAPTVDANGNVSYPLLSFDASFTISSPTGDATGTKSLSQGGTSYGVCPATPFGFPAEPTSAQILAPTTYTAQITTVAGTTTDTGTSIVDFADTGVRGIPNLQGFNILETFVSEAFANAPPGKATGGGQVDATVAFGFVAMRQPSGLLQGNCDVVDEVLAVHVKCQDVTDYTQTQNTATFTGHATVDGVPTDYRIDVTDNGEPGTLDTFAIQTGTGYTAGGPLTAGNVQVH